MNNSVKTPSSTLRAIAPHFQRSINLTYDSGNAEYVAGYIPTENGATALARVLRNTQPDGRERAHVLHAPYGSGKSLLSLVLSSFFQQDPDSKAALAMIMDRLQRQYPDQAAVINDFYSSGRRLLPVVLSGNEGEMTAALTRGLSRSVSKLGLGDFRPRTQFQSALNMIEHWEQLYPSAFQTLHTELNNRGETVASLVAALQDAQVKALSLFAEIHPVITAGAKFDGFAHASLADAFHDTATALSEIGYDGIAIIWDEFGRFMEASVGEAFGHEVALLQDFAEFCNRSGEAQVHLILVTHRQLSTYASDLPTSYQHEWARIAERFRPQSLVSDPGVVYRLIAEAFETSDLEGWEGYLEAHQEVFREQSTSALEYGLFEGIDDLMERQRFLENTWPLHPLTVYALPLLSSQVAQNERTLFTFLAADQPNSLQMLLAERAFSTDEDDWWQIGIDAIWDYFVDGIREDSRPGGSHAIWSGVMYALSKVAHNDFWGQQVVKTLGVLTVIGDVHIQQSQKTHRNDNGRVVPSSGLIAWAMGASVEAVEAYLKTLARRRVVAFRRADGYWTFTRGSDVDIEHEISRMVATQAPSRLQLLQLLHSDAPLPYHLPRGHNLKCHITRYFAGIYRWVDDLTVPWGSDEAIKRLGSSHAVPDGAVVYVLVLNSVDRDEAIAHIKTQLLGRAVYVVPKRPLLILEPLQELFALRELQNNPQFIDQDRDRLPRELAFFVEDAQRRLELALSSFHRAAECTWFHSIDGAWQTTTPRNQGMVSRLLTELCEQRFALTPILNNESLNLQRPSKQQITASEKVIDKLLKRYENNIFPFDLDLTGYGPDRLILRTILVQTGLLEPISEDDANEPQAWELKRPRDAGLGTVWDVINDYLDKAIESQQAAEDLLIQLRCPPFGLRDGVLPIILATMMRPRMQVITFRRDQQEVSPISGQTFTDLCRHPELFTIEVGVWDERRQLLWQVLEQRIFGFLARQEQDLQPLSYLSVGLLRWLQSLPRYCRDTQELSEEALALRNLIRKAQREPARVLLYELLDVLEDPLTTIDDETAYLRQLQSKLTRLMDEIADAYQSLRYKLDRFAEKEFALPNGARLREGKAILSRWLQNIETVIEGDIDSYRFNDVLAQRFVDCIRAADEPSQFWEQLSFALLGVSTSDWNDQSVVSFEKAMLQARERLQRELLAIEEDEDVIQLSVSGLVSGERKYLFRPSDLSKQGQMILENYKTTMAIAGRPLSPDEKRQVALAFLNFILEGNDPDHERKNRSLR